MVEQMLVRSAMQQVGAGASATLWLPASNARELTGPSGVWR